MGRSSHFFLVLLCCVLLFACGGGDADPPTPDEPEADPPVDVEFTPEAIRAGLDRVVTDLRVRRDQLVTSNAYPLPDLVPARPTIMRQVSTPEFVEFVPHVTNAGNADAGPFTVTVEAWVIDAGEDDEQIIEGPLTAEERWVNGVPAGATVGSDEFLPPDQRLRVDISGMQLPVAVAVWYTVDPADAQRPWGEVIEKVEGANANSAIYSSSERNPSLPILIH